MSDHFVKYINIERYKCFDDFSAEGFKRVNLISGRNNVGKTALLEAILINVNSKDVHAAIQSLEIFSFYRSKIDNDYSVKSVLESLKEAQNTVRFITNVNVLIYEPDDSELLTSYEVSTSNDSKIVSDVDIRKVLQSASETHMSAGFIGSVRDSQTGIIDSFTAVQKKDRESDVYEIIKKFDNSIENVKIIGGDSIQFKVYEADGSFSYRNISEFGDGLRHYLSIIADLFKAEDRYLFIDELDSGIHYTALDQLWEIILTLSRELNVQVFATTHSRECIESYCRVAEQLEEQDISFTTLVRDKNKAVKAIVRDYEVFTDSIHDEREVRGW